MKIVNLIGFPLTVGVESPVVVPAGDFRAVAPQIGGGQALPPVEADGLGTLPVISVPQVSLDQCVLLPGGAPFPAPEQGVIYLAPLPVRDAAIRAGRVDVWGMGDRIDGADPSKGVKNLVAPVGYTPDGLRAPHPDGIGPVISGTPRY